MSEPRLRMDAYYYGFSDTGVRCIDEILSAVAVAGKGCHHTEGWYEMGYIEKIQHAAKAAAARLSEVERERDTKDARVRELEAALEEYGRHKKGCGFGLDALDEDCDCGLRAALEGSKQ